MISKNELQEIARFTRLKPYQQEKHYIQTIVLNSIFSSITEELVFKGGTALFFFYNLPRFSEDLDFTSIKQFDKQLILKNLNTDLTRIGANNKITNIEENDISFSFRVDAEGPLFTKPIERCYVKVEISKREIVDNFSVKDIKSIYPDIPNFSVCLMDLKEIIAEKIRALLTRDQARDLFDIYFLLKKDVKVDIGLVEKKLLYYHKKFDKNEIINKINKLKGIWSSELTPFIFTNLPKFSEVKSFVLKSF